MNKDEVKSLVGQLSTLVLSLLTGAGMITSAQDHSLQSAIMTLFTSASAAVPAVMTVASVASSVYRHWNMKKVPETAKVA